VFGLTAVGGRIERPPLCAWSPSAIEVQGLLAQGGQHRSVSIPDLLVAATAERHGPTVLHYDDDYDRIAVITGQKAEWIVPRGTADHAAGSG
jgi:predicted nucleic acid-binding protein